jgi:hypothetical protein
MVTLEHNPAPFDVESGEASLDFKPLAVRSPAGISLVDEPDSYSRGNRNIIQ